MLTFSDVFIEKLPSLKSFEYGFDQFSRSDEFKADLSPLITEAMRELSYSLETLIVNEVVDVSLFFAPFSGDDYSSECVSGHTWPRLRDIFLHGTLIDLETTDAESAEKSLGISIGRAVEFMPELRSLTVSNNIMDEGPFLEGSSWVDFSLERCPCKEPTGSVAYDFSLCASNHKTSSIISKTWNDSLWGSGRRLSSVVEKVPDGED